MRSSAGAPVEAFDFDDPQLPLPAARFSQVLHGLRIFEANADGPCFADNLARPLFGSIDLRIRQLPGPQLDRRNLCAHMETERLKAKLFHQYRG